MRLQLETITSQVNRSFNLMFNPRLSDLFFWHFHPEYELVYIQNATGTRHVGEHSSTYNGSDLVLIGSNIPHLNFDYGVRSDYQKVVVHLKKELVEQHFALAPELRSIQRLLEQSKHGIAFPDEKKDLIGAQLFQLENVDPFDQYIQLTKILKLLSEIEEVELLHVYPYRNKFNDKKQERLQLIYAFVDKNYQRKITLDEISSLCFMTKEAFCRYFRKMTQYTFVEFLNRYRISHSKRHLMLGESVGEACYQAGFDSLSYYNRIFKKITGENPSSFRKRHL